jgi:hypothetical protein
MTRHENFQVEVTSLLSVFSSLFGMSEQLSFHVGVCALSFPDTDRSTFLQNNRQTLAAGRVRCHFERKKEKNIFSKPALYGARSDEGNLNAML